MTYDDAYKLAVKVKKLLKKKKVVHVIQVQMVLDLLFMEVLPLVGVFLIKTSQDQYKINNRRLSVLPHQQSVMKEQ